jgi:tetratricopeptide (TPR) repeat protein
MRDDDALDLSAWEAPPPPDGLADAVIARMDGTAVGLAMPEDPPSRKRALVIGASAAAALLVAAGAWAILRGREHAPPVSGEVVADRAQHLELGGASADLDHGAEIRWQRTGGRLHVEQKAGTAVWRVGEEHVEIAAAVASIEATNASLKVEVPMNLTDARVIGASAVTAAAVAMVTVVVYEGHVKVHHGEQTVIVQPGTTFRVPPPTPEPPVVGAAPATVPSGARKLAVLGLEGWSGDAVPRELVDALRARVNAGPFVLAPDSEKELVDEKLLYNCTDERPSCMAAIGKDLGADALIYGSMTSQRAGYQVAITWFDVGHASVAHQVVELIPATHAQGAALRDEASRLFDRLTATTTCDATASIEKGNNSMGMGAYAAALASYEQAVSCDPTLDRAVKLAFLASCKSRNVAKARTYFAKLTANEQTAYVSICVRQGITPDQLGMKPSCDADDLVTKGEGADTRGDYAESLSWMEKALACDPSQTDRIVNMVVMEACKSKNIGKAKLYLGKVSEPMRSKLALICERQGVMLDQPQPPASSEKGRVKISCDPTAHIMIDGKDTGQTTPASFELAPGKHKVTFVIGGDRFTYPVTIKAGETETLSKDLH